MVVPKKVHLLVQHGKKVGVKIGILLSVRIPQQAEDTANINVGVSVLGEPLSFLLPIQYNSSQVLLSQYYCRISLASVLMTIILLTGYAGMRDRHVSRAQLN